MIYRAIVADVRDPSERKRIKVIIPALTGQSVSQWIWPMVAGEYLVLPAPGDQVWVALENGDTGAPVWLGTTAPDHDVSLQEHDHSNGIGQSIPQSSVDGLANSLSTLSNSIAQSASLDSPALTGTPTVPTAVAGTSSGQIASTQFVQDAVTVAVSSTTVVPTASTYFSPSASSGGSIVTTTHNGSTVTVLLPADGAVNFEVGTQITFFQRGTSQILFSAGYPASIEATPGLRTRTRYSAATASKVDSNVWAVYGDLTT